ncbi:MAG: putative glycoside hydrolase [Oscillospiraceae bacterium]|jgi:hypothetical protein|nr:putative glycoside hydrolase [Oscillospiraceae bacterium]
MRQSKDWIYGPLAKRRRGGGKASAALAAVCLLAACGVFFGVMHKYGGWGARPGQEATESAPAAETATEGEPAAELPCVKVKGLYVTAWSAGMADRMSHYIELCDTTEINALVLDVKDDRGQITFLNSVEGASQASFNIIPDIEKIVSRLKEHGIYAIARLVCFKDPLWSRLHPGLAIRNARGAPWKDADGVTWLDPYNRASWGYIAAVAKQAARLGFDEIQLDYVRFPAGGNLREIDYGSAGGGKPKAEAIGEFLAYVRAALAGTGAKLSADIFGITAIHSGDFEDIGQDLLAMAQHADTICPMVYPSHFANKRQNGVGQFIAETLFEAPDTQPYGVIYNTLILIRNRLPSGGRRAGIRPYLQDFTASYLGAGYYQTYAAGQVREQVQAVYDAGFEEWILWNPSGVYSEDAFM